MNLVKGRARNEMEAFWLEMCLASITPMLTGKLQLRDGSDLPKVTQKICGEVHLCTNISASHPSESSNVSHILSPPFSTLTLQDDTDSEGQLLVLFALDLYVRAWSYTSSSSLPACLQAETWSSSRPHPEWQEARKRGGDSILSPVTAQMI
jgi:hypothetical protein